jgi:hypothetical protein
MKLFRACAGALRSAPAGHRAAFFYERRRPEETALYQVAQEQLETRAPHEMPIDAQLPCGANRISL